MKTLQKNLDFLLDKYSVDKKAVLKDKKTVVIDGKEVPTLPHRSERRFIELKNIVQGGTLVGISVMRVARIIDKKANLDEALARELDLCQWILGRKIKTVMAFKNENVMNIIAKTEDDVVCTIELSMTLQKGAKPIDKHEIISSRGIACDVVVDAQLKQDSVYVYGKDEKKFTDVDFELYGLSIDEIAAVRAAFAVAQKNLTDENLKAFEEIKNLVNAVNTSAATTERVVL